MRYSGYKFKKRAHGVIELQTKEVLTVLHIPDTHFPFHHPYTFKFLKEVSDHYKPDIVIHQGDEVDNAAISNWTSDADMPGATDELDQAVSYMHKLYELFPEVLVCKSNHTARPYRCAHAAGIPMKMMKSYNEILQAPEGWSWHDRIVINNVLAIHGEGGSGRQAAWKHMTDNKMSVVIGHIHGFGGVTYSQDPFRQTFAANAGCLLDLDSMAMRYGNKYANKGTLGCVVVRGKDAQFIRMDV